MMKKFVIHNYNRHDRLKFIDEFTTARVNDVIIYDAIVEDNGAAGYIKTIREIVSNNSNEKMIMLFDDDIKFTSPDSWVNFLTKAKHIKNSHGVDVIIGGASHIIDKSLIKEPYFQLSDFSGSFMILLFKSAYKHILSDECLNAKHFDRYIGKLCEQGKLTGYAVYPFVAKTTSGYSDIRKKEVNDESYFQNYKFL